MRHKKLVVLLVLAAVAVVLVAIALVPRGPAPSTALEPSSSPSPDPPAWLLEDMSRQARNCGDPHAAGWWTLTTAEKATVVEYGDAPPDVSDPDRPVYVYVIQGDFTRWLWSLPAGASAPTYSWVFVLIDAKSRMADVVGTSPTGFDTTGLTMQSVVLTEDPSPSPSMSASNVSGNVMLRGADGESPGGGLLVTAHSPRSDRPQGATRTDPDGAFELHLKPGWYLLTVGYWGEPALQIHVPKTGVAFAPIRGPSQELAATRIVKVNQVPSALPPLGVRIGANVLLVPAPAQVPRLISKSRAARVASGSGSARVVLAVVSARGVRVPPKPLKNWLAWVVVRRVKRPFDAVIGGPGIPRPAMLVLNSVSLIDARTGRFLLGFFTR